MHLNAPHPSAEVSALLVDSTHSTHSTRSTHAADAADSPRPRPTAPPRPQWPARGERRRRTDHNAAADTAAACMAMVLDEIDYGMFLLDARQRVRHANRAAMTQLRLGRGLCMVDDALHPTEARDLAAWDSAIEAAAHRGLRRLVSIGQGEDRIAVAIVPLPSPSSSSSSSSSSSPSPSSTHTPVQAPAQPFMHDGAPAANPPPPAEARVLVLLSRRKICEELSAYGFARDHGLTGAEGQVLSSLCRGLEPVQIAAGTGVAISTVRTQIANIRIKVQVASIRELVQRIAQLPPLLGALRDDHR